MITISSTALSTLDGDDEVPATAYWYHEWMGWSGSGDGVG